MSTTSERRDPAPAVATDAAEGQGAAEPHGERAEIRARLIVSTAHGVFQPTPVYDLYRARRGIIRSGETVGTVGGSAVVSRFTGYFMGLLALPGERIRLGQALAWVLPLQS